MAICVTNYRCYINVMTAVLYIELYILKSHCFLLLKFSHGLTVAFLI